MNSFSVHDKVKLLPIESIYRHSDLETIKFLNNILNETCYNFIP